MGAFSTKKPVRIENQPGWDDGEYIEIKGSMTAGDMEQIAKQEYKQGASGRDRDKCQHLSGRNA